ncbi:MAG: hypothetical protein ACK5NG_09145 [Chthoniobacterales bacterium]
MLSWVPFKEVIIIALIMQGFKEAFPFSHFPMYSQIPADTEYYYLTDLQGTLIGQEAVFGIRSAKMKKLFRSRLEAITKGEEATTEQLKAAGEKTLAYMVEHIPFESGRDLVKKFGLQLHCVRVERTDETFKKDHRMIAEFRIP